MQVGDIVKIKPPFSDLSKEHIIVEISDINNGELVYFVDEFDGGFSEIHLESF